MNNPFSELSIDYDWQKDVVTLRKPFSFYCRQYKLLVTAHEDFTCNGLSIPRVLWSIYGHPFYRKNIEAAIIHDFLYRYHILSRYKSDKIFFYAAQEHRNSIQAYPLYAGVRMFGYPAWKKHKKSLKG